MTYVLILTLVLACVILAWHLVRLHSYCHQLADLCEDFCEMLDDAYKNNWDIQNKNQDEDLIVMADENVTFYGGDRDR